MNPTRRGFLGATAALATLPVLPLPIDKMVKVDPRDLLLEDHEDGKCKGGCGAVLGMTCCRWYVIVHHDGERWFICDECGDEWAGKPGE